jgi:hypothetical protein
MPLFNPATALDVLGWYDVERYGADPALADNALAIETAIAAAVAAGGGTVYFPNDDYATAVRIALPSVDPAGGAPIPLRLLGGGSRFTHVGSAGCSRIVTTATTLGVLYAQDYAGSFSGVHLVIENMGFVTPDNPPMPGLDLTFLSAVTLKNVIVGVNGSSEPTTNTSVGIKFPPNNNNGFCRAEEVLVVGFYNGADIGEHFYGDNFGIANAKVGLRVFKAFHANYFARLEFDSCKTCIQAQGSAGGSPANCHLSIAQLDIERAAAGWQAPSSTYEIDDPNNLLMGWCMHTVVIAGSGNTATILKNQGADPTFAVLASDRAADLLPSTITQAVFAAAGDEEVTQDESGWQAMTPEIVLPGLGEYHLTVNAMTIVQSNEVGTAVFLKLRVTTGTPRDLAGSFRQGATVYTGAVYHVIQVPIDVKVTVAAADLTAGAAAVKLYANRSTGAGPPVYVTSAVRQSAAANCTLTATRLTRL